MKVVWISIIIIFVWFILGLFEIISVAVFSTGLLALCLGGFLMDLENQGEGK